MYHNKGGLDQSLSTSKKSNENVSNISDSKQIEQNNADSGSTNKFKTNTTKAIVFANLFALMVFFYQALAKYTMETGVKILDLSLCRVLFLMPQSYIVLKWCGVSLFVPRELRLKLFIRCTVGVTSFIGIGFGIYLMPLLYNQILFNLSPFWLFLLAHVFLGETMTKFHAVALVLCFSCIVVMSIAQPADLENQTDSDQKYAYTTQTKIIGMIVMLLSSFCYSIASLLTRVLQSVHTSVVMFYYGLVGVFILATAICIQAIISGEMFQFVSYTSEQWGLLVLIACVNALSLNFNNIAMQNENPAFVSLINYSGVFYAFLGDIFIFKISFTAIEVISAIFLIILTTSVIIMKLMKLNAAAQKQKDDYMSAEIEQKKEKHHD